MIEARRLVRTVPKISKVLDMTERSAYHALETGQIAGATKIAGRWVLDLDTFYASLHKSAAA